MVDLTKEQVNQLATIADPDPDAHPAFRIENTNLDGVIAVTPFGDDFGDPVLIDREGRTAVLASSGQIRILPG